MGSLKRAAQNSLDSVIAGRDDTPRVQEITAVGKAPKRAALLAVHATVVRFPRLTAKLLGAEYPKGLVKVGEGLQSEVFRITDSDTVLKIVNEHDGYNNPIQLSRRERRQLKDEMAEQHAVMASYAGATVLPHEFEVGAHPLYRDREAIRITQPYDEINFVWLSDYDAQTGREPDTSQLSLRIDGVEQTNPGFVSDLRSFVNSGKVMAHEQGLVVDVVGNNNGGVSSTSGRLTYVDSQPVPASRPEEQAFALHHLERLDMALAELETAA
ncbi:MAG TPA: hypothetical protein VHB72_04765 [Candidatus Saccharimonadales bacterium]|nr:hypothetical protein [Candidatus Saccharimonadales bacterium]